MITLNSLSKIYRTDEIETVALENVNLTVERGEFLSIMGPVSYTHLDVYKRQAERSLVFKSQNIGNLFGAFVAVKQETFSFRFHPFVDNPKRRRQFAGRKDVR